MQKRDDHNFNNSEPAYPAFSQQIQFIVLDLNKEYNYLIVLCLWYFIAHRMLDGALNSVSQILVKTQMLLALKYVFKARTSFLANFVDWLQN